MSVTGGLLLVVWNSVFKLHGSGRLAGPWAGWVSIRSADYGQGDVQGCGAGTGRGAGGWKAGFQGGVSLGLGFSFAPRLLCLVLGQRQSCSLPPEHRRLRAPQWARAGGRVSLMLQINSLPALAVASDLQGSRV